MTTAATNAQRQAKYRKTRDQVGDNGERRINIWVTTGAALAIERLARRYGVTKRELLERLVVAEDKTITDSLDINSPEWDKYFVR